MVFFDLVDKAVVVDEEGNLFGDEAMLVAVTKSAHKGGDLLDRIEIEKVAFPLKGLHRRRIGQVDAGAGGIDKARAQFKSDDQGGLDGAILGDEAHAHNAAVFTLRQPARVLADLLPGRGRPAGIEAGLAQQPAVVKEGVGAGVGGQRVGPAAIFHLLPQGGKELGRVEAVRCDDRIKGDQGIARRPFGHRGDQIDHIRRVAAKDGGEDLFLMLIPGDWNAVDVNAVLGLIEKRDAGWAVVLDPGDEPVIDLTASGLSDLPAGPEKRYHTGKKEDNAGNLGGFSHHTFGMGS